ncbi:class I SAM-dependent methyltransferase [Gephyromycinifex aptenodytis]|uniref:class I SAM-dependent methyltransferase n=1 Tax=Gephyromycinifex aptenodytis TaxID=2716227 RepID=UPI0014467B14|nr:class I SAM-dependent methyltransferase [Gephyromycinifex aptenodytis]
MSEGAVATLRCRICQSPLFATFVDLGASPPCEAILTAAEVDQGEVAYPLHARICTECLLVQVPEILTAAAIFTDEYPYFSSFSTSWVAHAKRFVDDTCERLQLDGDSFIIEVASNDGYLLQHVRDLGIRCLGIEPTANTAGAAKDKGIETQVCFLGAQTAAQIVERHGRADLVIANNVFAHVPDLRDFTQGLATLLAEEGTLTIEVPHLAKLIELRQYDTIYHEHFQYFTLLTASRALALGGLVVVDVMELPTHGGSLRIYAQHANHARPPSPAVAQVLAAEKQAGLHTLQGHLGFEAAVASVKRGLLRFLLDAQENGRTVVGYGAPGKGNTLLNHCGIRADLLPFTVDMNPHKHGKFLPGSRIPVRPPSAIAEAKPDYVLVLPWNLRDEITAQLAPTLATWGGKLVFAVPSLDIVTPEGSPQ